MSDIQAQSAEEKNPDYVYFISSVKPPPGEAREHAFLDFLFPREANDVKKDWKVVIDQVVDLVSENVNTAPQGYRMDQIEVGLGFSAKGQLAFIAEAGVESSVKIVFKQLT